MKNDDARFTLSPRSARLHLKNVHPSKSNAVRRSVMSLAPSMRFDHAFIKCNTSLLKDEDFVHRLGLIPLYIDPNAFQFENESNDGVDFQSDATMNAQLGFGSGSRPGYPNSSHLLSENKTDLLAKLNPLMHMAFELKQTCECDSVTNVMTGRHVTSASIKWIPLGNQHELELNSQIKQQEVEQENKWMSQDLQLIDLLPGQSVDILLIAVKGLGTEHAKFAPANCGYYVTKLQEDDPMQSNEQLQDVTLQVRSRGCQLPQCVLSNSLFALQKTFENVEFY